MVDFTAGVVVVRNAPALTCTQCGDAWIEDAVVDKAGRDCGKGGQTVDIPVQHGAARPICTQVPTNIPPSEVYYAPTSTR